MAIKIKFDNGHTVQFDAQPSDADIEEAYAHTKTLATPKAATIDPRLYGKGYDEKYLPLVTSRNKRVSIPGAEAYDQAKPMSYEDYAKTRDKKYIDRLLSVPDVALSIASSPLAAVNAVGGAVANKLAGQEDFLPAYERIFNQSMWKPKTETGEDALNDLNPILGAFPAIGGYVGPLGKMRGKKKPVVPPKDFTALVADEAPIAEAPPVAAPDLRLEHPLAADTRVAAQNKSLRGADDWNSMEHAARAVEEEVAAMEQLQRQQADEALSEEQKATHAFLRDAQQDVIDDTPHGDRPAQFGMTDEHGRVDENGMPIRADLSIEAQNLQDPLQMSLWGDELPGRSQDGSIGMTQALDRMPPGDAREQALAQLSGVPPKDLASKVSTVLQDGLQGLSRTQRGAIDVTSLAEGFKKLKHLPNGITLHASAEGDGQLDVVARGQDGSYLGGTRMSPENYRNPTPQDFMASLGTDSTHRGLATEMYKFVSELGNDIVPAKSQTAAGKAMWAGFERKGLLNDGMMRGQRGAIDLQKSKKPLPDVEDLVLKGIAPRITPEQTTTANNTADKAAAVGMSQYSRITSPEQVLAAPGKDILPSYTGGRTNLISGVESMVRRYPDNKLLNFVRTTFQEARNQAEIWSKEFLTGKDGLNSHLNKLSQTEKNDLVGLLLALDKAQKPLTDAVMDRAEFSPAQKLAATRLRTALDHLYTEKTKALGEQGFDAHMYREGYVPANFGGAYKSLVGHYAKDGSWVTTGIAQADTLYGLKKAEAWYRSQDGSVDIIRAGTSKLGTGRTGLKQSSGVGRSNDAWANLIAALAKVDPKFAEAKAMADQKGVDATASLYDYQAHELRKKGVTGALGDRPWLDRDSNTKQFIEGLVQYLEDGYRYTAYQKPLVETSKLVSNPELRKQQLNAAQYAERYMEHIKRQGLNPVGAGLNFAVDAITASMGLGHGKLQKVAHEISHYSALQMMGFANIGFFGMQLTQLFSGGMPEAMSIAARHNLDPQTVPNSLNTTRKFLTDLGLERIKGETRDIPQHMRDAFEWADKVGMFTFSESELAHQVLQSKVRKATDKVLDASIRYGELATRPVVFLWYADMFKQAGFEGHEALTRAQAATDFAMVNYHPDERPMLYQSLGVVGSLMGALSTYKHNYVTQGITRTANVFKEPAAMATFFGLGLTMYGLGGFPGYDEADSLVNKFTGKSIRQHVLDDPSKKSVGMDGWLSAATELDFQSRLSMSSMFPDSPASMFPHISNVGNVMMKGFEAALHPDVGSFQDLALAGAPKSIANAAEAAIWEDGNVRSRKTGENKYDTPRTPKEELIRALTGIKPLRETIEDKNTYSSRVTEARRQDKLKAAQQRFDRAWLLRDAAGMDKAVGDYTENSGDITTLYDSNRLATLEADSKKSEKARRAGLPSNVNTLKTYETFMGK